MRFGTKAIHAGIEPDPTTGAIMTPIYQTSTYVQESPGKHKGYAYSRTHNPTRTALQKAVAALEEGQYGICYASGLAATDAILKLLKPGDEVLASSDLYGGTYRVMRQIFEQYGITFRFVDLSAPQRLAGMFTPLTRLVWMETPTNPLLKIIDIAAICRQCRSRNVLSVVDNTFASPYLQTPLNLGADIVLHSITKYLSGHSDIILGAVVVNDEVLAHKLTFIQNASGAVPGPQDCFLALRGIKTLHLRMKRHCENAFSVAEWLKAHPKVSKVYYPGLTDHPGHQIAKKQMNNGFGGVVSFEQENDRYDDAVRFMERLSLFSLGESLGGVESLCTHPASMSHAGMPKEVREQTGLKDTLVRLSVGVEDIEDILEDLRKALI